MELIWLAAGIFIGIAFGMSLQWRRDEAYIGRLEEWKRKPMRVIVQPDFEIDLNDWGEDTFDMDELQMRQTGSVN